MSILGSRESRGRASRQAGFSAGAAFLFAMILAGVAVAIQMTMPVTTSPASLAIQTAPESQTAAINGMAPLNVAPESQLAQTTRSEAGGVQSTATQTGGAAVAAYDDGAETNGEKKDFQGICRSGMDLNVMFNSSGVLQSEGSSGRRRCAEGDSPKVNEKGGSESVIGWSEHESLQQFLARTVDQSRTYADYFHKNEANGKLENINRTCIIKPNSNPQKWDQNLQWKCLVRVCIPAAENSKYCDIYAVAQGTGIGTSLYNKVVNDAINYTTLGQPDGQWITNLQESYKIPPGPDSDALVNAFSEQQDKIDDARAKLDESLGAQKSAQENLASIQRFAAECERTGADCSDAKAQVAEAQKAKQAADESAIKNAKALNELQKNAVPLAPGQRCPPGDTSAACINNQNGPPNDAGVINKNIADAIRNSTFNGNNTPSPLGGPCTTGYICQGGTLYYQSMSGSTGSYTECRAMPVQQCPYGCQQAFGAQQGQQQQSTLGGIMAGVQIFSALSSMFGGSNSTMANPNQSRSCAMSPQMQQMQNPYGTGNQGQPCQQPQTQQPDPSQCSSGSWQPQSQNGCFAGWQCVPNGSAGSNQPTAQLSCQPQVADVGMPISFSFSCGNASGSTGSGFNTQGALSGNATGTVPMPPEGQNTATYALTCIKLGITASAQCQIQIGKPGIVMVTNPKSVKGGETSLIGWVTSGMKSCVISSPQQQDFTTRNAGITVTSGVASTSPIVTATRFVLDCETLGGDRRQSETTVTLQN